ncbi:MAG: M48 family metalloprotease [Rhodospirillaceae bacterium]|jgi:beta-barrel assembly-enhancing protease|nr:M48 family metalloprotease [Rhodospirillaceae bacterium]MBT5309259.1 M48 family metalloprotease [Rhodospirillaceae bacterium]MBT7355004.1 M48 family metalloprotease [Rhodospirillaceae bacterium]
MNKAVYERPLIDNDIILSSESKSSTSESYPYSIASLQPQQRPDVSSLEAGLWMSVEKAEKKSQTAGNRVTDKKLNDYVRSIVCRLAKEYCQDIRIYIMRVPMFNASMYPNGMMHIWTGLLLRARNEAQLATVLGHEIGHYLRRHSLQRFKTYMNTSNSLIFAQMALAVAGAPAVGDIMNIVARGSLAAFSRDHEREADGYGLLLLAKGGYDPFEASKIWKRSIREAKADKKYSSPSIFNSTHPQSEERMKVLNDLAGRVWTDETVTTGLDEYKSVILPLRASFLRDELDQRNFSSTEELLEILIEDGANLSELHFFKGEMYRLRRKKGDLDKALNSYRESLALGNPPSVVHRQIGLALRRQGDAQGAKDSLKKYLELNPDVEDAGVIRQIIEESEE